MNFILKTSAAALLAAGLFVAYAHASDPAAPKKHAATRRAEAPAKPDVQAQIDELRQELQSQIDSLKTSLADKDAQLKQAQQDAADARAAAARAEAAASSQQQAVTENSAAVTTLQSTVTDLKSNNVSVATTLSDETSAIKKSIANPDALNYKGITLSPAGSFLAAETVWRRGPPGTASTPPSPAFRCSTRRPRS
jgi:chromosome segregation ATPase